MPVIFIGHTKRVERHGRGRGFDRRVAVLAPVINALRSEGVHAP
jgi:hypothetical protein